MKCPEGIVKEAIVSTLSTIGTLGIGDYLAYRKQRYPETTDPEKEKAELKKLTVDALRMAKTPTKSVFKQWLIPFSMGRNYGKSKRTVDLINKYPEYAKKLNEDEEVNELQEAIRERMGIEPGILT